MTADPLYIDGKLVTESNARRFVIARAPSAETRRETDRGFTRVTTTVVVTVRDRTFRPPWCHARAKTAKEAWLKVARQMVEHDARVAAEKLALEQALSALCTAKTPAALQEAALRYAATRVRRFADLDGNERNRFTNILIEMATSQEPQPDEQ